MGQIFRKIKNYLPSLRKLHRYARKLKKDSKQVSKFMGIYSAMIPAGMILQLQNTFVVLSLFIGVIAMSFLVFERKSMLPSSFFFGFWLLCLAPMVSILLILLLFDWMYKIKLNLILVRLSFPRQWGIIYLEMAYFIGIVGVCLILLSFLCNKTRGNGNKIILPKYFY